MDTNQYMILIQGQDKSDSIESFRSEENVCHIIFRNNMEKDYHYKRGVEILKLQKKIDLRHNMVAFHGKSLTNAKELLDFGSHYRIIYNNGKTQSCLRHAISFMSDTPADESISTSLLDYFKETASIVGLVPERGHNILSQHYNSISAVNEDTILASYFSDDIAPLKRMAPSFFLYPFDLNQSQKAAVENAFSSQISIIQGPPGTGKTQTILNIIANAVFQGKTVAVVSNNNAATMNVAEKLEKKQLSFLTAYLGNHENIVRFLEGQDSQYPDMAEWLLTDKVTNALIQTVIDLTNKINKLLNTKNRIAEIEQELLAIQPELHSFQEYYETYATILEESISSFSSQKILDLWLEYEKYVGQKNHLGLFKMLSILFYFNRSAIRLFSRSPEAVIPYLQNQFYKVKISELTNEKCQLESKLADDFFDSKMKELSRLSFLLFRSVLAKRYCKKNSRKQFSKKDLQYKSYEFNQEYPVVLSTTYSIKGVLNPDYVYDYLIIDEASQVDLLTGALAFSCARNVVIVGDLQQLPNVLQDAEKKKSDEIWNRYSFPETYHHAGQCLLSSAVQRWADAPSILLREHYRCHPKIIGFCNQKFYNGQLIIMTQDHGETGVLTLYRTVEGNHARGHINQRQIDVIKKEVLPRLNQNGLEEIGIISPYKDQEKELIKQLGDKFDIATVHKFQGREKDAVILTSVDNIIGEFVDQPNMLNVAVSRAVKSLSVIMSNNAKNEQTNYGDLAHYIMYHNCEIINSTVFSVFDLLYQSYAQRRRIYLKKYNRISKYDSENLLYSVIRSILNETEFAGYGCAVHVSLATIIKGYKNLDPDEQAYVRNPLTHVDFLLFDQMDKLPVGAIELDGVRYHSQGSKQAERDIKKNGIFKKCGIPLLRIQTDQSGEWERIREFLRNATKN